MCINSWTFGNERAVLAFLLRELSAMNVLQRFLISWPFGNERVVSAFLLRELSAMSVLYSFLTSWTFDNERTVKMSDFLNLRQWTCCISFLTSWTFGNERVVLAFWLREHSAMNVLYSFLTDIKLPVKADRQHTIYLILHFL